MGVWVHVRVLYKAVHHVDDLLTASQMARSWDANTQRSTHPTQSVEVCPFNISKSIVKMTVQIDVKFHAFARTDE